MALPPIRVLCASVLVASSTALLGPELSFGRRGVLSAAASTLIPEAKPAKQDPGTPEVPATRPAKQDFAAKSSFFGLAAPPIQAAWSYDELLREARSGTVATVQIAVQHDCVIAVTTSGHRYSCLLPDRKFPVLLADAMLPDGSMPFEVLPMDAMRAQVREAAKIVAQLGGTYVVADFIGLLPWWAAPYNSLEEREQAREQAARGEKPPAKLQLLLEQVRALKPPPGLNKGLGLKARENGAATGHDEALRRVLGFTTWDAAAELKQREKMKDRLRPRQLEQTLINARPHELEQRLIKARPHELEQTLLNARDATVAELKATVDEVETLLREAPWASPQTLDTSELPSLDELFTKAWRVHYADGVAQYIRAHPSSAAKVEEHAFPKPTLVGGPWPSDEEGEEDVEEVPLRAKDRDVCRLCPHFSALYGHNVYICKRLVPSPA